MPRLRTVSPNTKGFSRRRAGAGWIFLDKAGQRITDPDEIERIKSLAIPPAWQDVWISPYPNGHIQAVGTDDAGRRQYLYHPDWRIKRDKMKFDRVLAAARKLPAARRAIKRDLALEGMPLERADAVAVRLLDLGYFRDRQRHLRRHQRLLRAHHPGEAARPQGQGPAGLPVRGQVRHRAQHRDRRPRGAGRAGQPAPTPRRVPSGCSPTSSSAAGATSTPRRSTPTSAGCSRTSPPRTSAPGTRPCSPPPRWPPPTSRATPSARASGRSRRRSPRSRSTSATPPRSRRTPTSTRG